MENPNPVTLPKGTDPGNDQPKPVTSSSGSQPATDKGQGGNQAEGQVTISTKEYADLQRAKARSLSFEKRAQFFKKNPPKPQSTNGDGSDDPEMLEQLRQEQEARAESDKRANRAEITLKVRDILEKEEFKVLPESTKALILKNPHMLSQADNVEEALLDIEDFVRDQVAGLKVPNSSPNPGQGGSRAANPSGHETPSSVSAGAPAPASAIELEDVSNLSGVARSRAVLRNSMKKARGVK